MSNPFYPPRGIESGRVSRGIVGKGGEYGVHGAGYDFEQRNVSFDPDRRGAHTAYEQQGQGGQAFRRDGRDSADQRYDDDDDGKHGADERYEVHQRRQATDGPGGAATFYPSEYVSDPALGTGTDGFGAGQSVSTRGGVHAQRKQNDGYAYTTANPDYRSSFTPTNTNQRYLYPDGSNKETIILEQESPIRERFAESSYPPPNQFGYSRSTFDLRAPLTANADRPDSPGIYRDRAPRMDKLSPEQQKIASTFPKDLDEEGGSLLKTAVHMCKDWRSFVRWKYLHYYVLLVFLCVLVALMTIYHRQIVDWLTPASQKVRTLSWGWVIPVIILFILSFPPLFGHEIVGVLCGVVYGLWVGFGILSLGTLLGELGNFYAFKYFLQRHGERFEQKSIDYACMAHIVREGGFIIVLLARLSAIPGHFTTAVFSTVGMNVFVFTIAAILSLPKQLVVVYLGVAIEQAGSGTESTRSKVIKWVVLILSFLVTLGVAVYLYGKMQQARPIVQERLRAKRYKMLMEAGPAGENTEGFAGQQANAAGHLSSSPSDDGFFKVETGAGFQESASNTSTLNDANGRVNGAKKPSMWARMTGRGKQSVQDTRQPATDASQVAMHSMHHVSYEPRSQSDQRYAHQALNGDMALPFYDVRNEQPYVYDQSQQNIYAEATGRPTYAQATSYDRGAHYDSTHQIDNTVRVADDRQRPYDKQALAM